jgi:hypothetical protein
MKGTFEEVRSFEQLMGAADNEFDFNKLIPMPESLNIVEGSFKDYAIMAYLSNNASIPFSEELSLKAVSYGIVNMFKAEFAKDCYDCLANMTIQELTEPKDFSAGYDDKNKLMLTFYDAGKIYVENKKKYGFSSWYDWTVENWGTKWNSSEIAWDTQEEKKAGVQFKTAWSAPMPIIKALTEKFPNASIRIEFADEDIGCNCGYIEYDNGKITKWDPDAIIEEAKCNDDEKRAKAIRNEAIKFACDMWGYDFEEYLSEISDEDDDEDDDEDEDCE